MTPTITRPTGKMDKDKVDNVDKVDEVDKVDKDKMDKDKVDKDKVDKARGRRWQSAILQSASFSSLLLLNFPQRQPTNANFPQCKRTNWSNLKQPTNPF